MPYIVDIDDSIGQLRPRLRISIDQDRLEFFGVEQRDVYDTIRLCLAAHLSATRIAEKAATRSKS